MTSQSQRIPLAYPIGTRDALSLDKDPYIRNGMLEKYGDSYRVLKRPGSFTRVVQPAPFGTGQGVFYYNGFYFLVVGDVLYRTAGADLVKSDGSAWTQSAVPSWYGRAFGTATVFNGRIWVIGGEATFQYADVSYTVDGVTWAQNASGAPFEHRQGHQVVVLNDTMYLIGGLEVSATTTAVMNDVWSTKDGANWTQVTAAAGWDARVNFTAVAGNNGIYLYGGELSDASLADDVWYSVDGETWTQLTAAATGTPRFLQSMFFFNSKVWIIGGYADVAGTTTINDVNSSPDGQTWTATAPVFPTGKAIMASTIYHDMLWLIGGDAGGALTSDVWYSSSGTAWTLAGSSPGFTARGAGMAVTFNTPSAVNQYNYQTLWLLGGNDGATDLQQVWRANLNVSSPTSYVLSPTTSGQPYQFTTYMNGTKLVIKNQSNLWVLAGGALTKVVDPNYPTVTVPGVVTLNAFLYVMTPGGEIHSCEIDDPLTWPSLNFLTADYEDDPGIALAKHLNYVVAFGQTTIQLFYDNGANQPVGSALAPYQSATVSGVGCAQARTVVSCAGTLYWVANSTSNSRTVMRFNGVSPEQVSTFYVDRIIGRNSGNGNYAFELGTIDGRPLYVVAIVNGQFLVFDSKFGEWYEWDTLAPLAFATTFAQGVYTTLDVFGQLIDVSQIYYDDDGTEFLCSVQTPNEDLGNRFRKYWGRAGVICDQAAGIITLEATDDDYQTYLDFGTLDASLDRPNVTRLGSSRKRAWRVGQFDSNPSVRLEALEITYSQGESA